MLKKTLLALMLLTFSPLSMASDWLLGTWLLTSGSHGLAEDRLSFKTGRQLEGIDVSSGERARGLYFVEKDSVSVAFISEGKVTHKFSLTYDKKNQRLYYYSETGVSSYYTRIKF